MDQVQLIRELRQALAMAGRQVLDVGKITGLTTGQVVAVSGWTDIPDKQFEVTFDLNVPGGDTVIRTDIKIFESFVTLNGEMLKEQRKAKVA